LVQDEFVRISWFVWGLCYSCDRTSEHYFQSLRVFTTKANFEGSERMRLKLVFIASIIGALTGAGSAVAIILAMFSSLNPIASPGILVGAIFLLPITTCLLAAVFVYRHTARRRKLQAFLTAVLAISLSLATFIVAFFVTSRPQPRQPPALQPTNRA
jgi:ABC-type Fe3+-siderophore transport system permease subunit